MIDWTALLFNTVWILGTSLILAALSYQHWVAAETKQSLKILLNQPSFSRVSWAGFMLIAIGLAGTSQRTWETVVWIIFVVVNAGNFIWSFHTSKT